MTELYTGGGLSTEAEQSLAKAPEDVIDANIRACGDLVRQLKSEKATKDKIKAEVDVLLKLKKIFKDATSKDWKPDNAAKKTATPPPTAAVVIEHYTGGGLTPAQEKELETAAAEALDMKIKNCGDLIRKLKSDKVDKSQIQLEVSVLLKLKDAFKKRTGQDWKPAAAPDQAKPEASKKVVTEKPQPQKAEGEKSDKQLKREAKKAEKQAKKAQHKSEASSTSDQSSQQQNDSSETSAVDVSVGKYGIAQMNQSQSKSNLHLIDDFAILTEKLAGQTVWVRARLHTSRAKGKQCFFVLRQQQYTVQCIAYVSEEVSKQMIKFIAQ